MSLCYMLTGKSFFEVGNSISMRGRACWLLRDVVFLSPKYHSKDIFLDSKTTFRSLTKRDLKKILIACAGTEVSHIFYFNISLNHIKGIPIII